MVGLSVKTASKLSGVSPHTLRAWERRYQAVEPSRTKTGRRVYSIRDTERLSLLRYLVRKGHSIGNIARLEDAQLKSLIGKSDATTEATDRAANLIFDPTQAAERLIHTLATKDITLASSTLGEARKNLNPRTFILEIISPFLIELEARVDRGSINKAEKIGFTSVAREHLGLLYFGLCEKRSAPISSLSIAIATITQGSELTAFCAGIIAESMHIKTHYLGTAVSAWDLADTLRNLNASPLIIQDDLNGSSHFHSAQENYVSQLLPELDNNQIVWIISLKSMLISDRRLRKISNWDDCITQLHKELSDASGLSLSRTESLAIVA